jgi:hypothetical protein
MNAVWERLSRKEDKAEFVLWTGDHMSIFEPHVGMDAVRAAIKNVTDGLLGVRAATGARIYPILGNHDSSPMFQFPTVGPYYVYDAAATEWARIPDLSKASIASLRKALWYTELIRPGLRLVSLNTLMYYTMNFLIDHNVKDPSGQLAWLRSTLEQARRDHEYVYISTHIPPGYDEEKSVPEMWSIWNDGLWDVLEDFQDVITASFYGHLHYDTFRVYQGKNGTLGSAFLTSGTSTRGLNPSVTMYEYSTKPPFTILERINWYIDIDESNERDQIVWKLAYKATDMYGVKDLSPASLADYIQRMAGDRELFLKFWNVMKGSYTEDRTRCESDRCRKQALCYLTLVRTTDVKACIMQTL